MDDQTMKPLTSPGAAAPAALAEAPSSPNLLDQLVIATRQTERARAIALARTLTREALKGQLTFSRNLTHTLNAAITTIDARISAQLNAIMHDARFQRLEGSWRGLHHLVTNSETGDSLKIRMLNCTQRELQRNLSRAPEFDQSDIFKKIYEREFGSAGGEPFSVLIGDYEFTSAPQDVELLRQMSQVAAAAFAPFIAAASPRMFGFEDYRELSRPRDLSRIFDTIEYVGWRQFRDSDDSRFVTLTLPRTLARLPYGAATNPVERFAYDEAPVVDGAPRAMNHDDYCWMNSAYVLGARLTAAFAASGWCTAIRGAEGGGKVENLPSHVFTSDDGDVDQQCPTEVPVTDRRELELSRLGFLPLCHYRGADYAVFFGAQTTQKPRRYDRPEATANAAISARLPYILATSRFAHFLKIMARDKIGSFMEPSDCEAWLNRWIITYVNGNPEAGQEMKARYPLAEARVEIREIPGQRGAYNAIAWLRPWLQLEELSTSMRLVARIPSSG